jgi:3-hydroxyacyl-CoA dehydrogenase
MEKHRLCMDPFPVLFMFLGLVMMGIGIAMTLHAEYKLRALRALDAVSRAKARAVAKIEKLLAAGLTTEDIVRLECTCHDTVRALGTQ